MTESSYPNGAHDYANAGEENARLEAAMNDAPRGAAVLSLAAVALLLIGWLGIYFLVFLPRGTVG